MGAAGALSVAAVASGALFGAGMGAWASSTWRSAAAKMGSLELAKEERMKVLILGMSRPLRPLGDVLYRFGSVASAADAAAVLLKGKLKISGREILSAALLLLMASGLAAFVLTFSLPFAISLMAALAAGAWCWVRHATDAATEEVQDEVPQAFQLLADSFRSGHSLVQAMQQAASELGGMLGEAFKRASLKLEAGERTEDAMDALAKVKGVPELGFVAVALGVQHQCGGSIAPVLESAKDSVEDELELKRSLRIGTAQAKLSATIVTLMPFILIAFFSLASPGFLDPFFQSALGMILLTVALAMQAAGVFAVRRICRA